VLERFRRAAAVPAVVGDTLEAELMPVFAALDEIEAEAEHIRVGVRREVERRLAVAAAEAEQIVERHRRRAEAERARAEVERREAATREVHAIEAAAQEEAVRILSRGRERIPALVAEVVGSLTGERA
jgi:hypothetical protein